ncbi:hypothetical protein EVAR_46930_1 [Eumeta japonica]|uniref:Uncharacterized protein n=1 Tax=Eumeta variegata TaxID=151549 RepID=A0A4C2A212_EUMVA|nr:hypothetical protein EVAR_46930_1 [Eumeta japonica]
MCSSLYGAWRIAHGKAGVVKLVHYNAGNSGGLIAYERKLNTLRPFRLLPNYFTPMQRFRDLLHSGHLKDSDFPFQISETSFPPAEGGRGCLPAGVRTWAPSESYLFAVAFRSRGHRTEILNLGISTGSHPSLFARRSNRSDIDKKIPTAGVVCRRVGRPKHPERGAAEL